MIDINKEYIYRVSIHSVYLENRSTSNSKAQSSLNITNITIIE